MDWRVGRPPLRSNMTAGMEATRKKEGTCETVERHWLTKKAIPQNVGQGGPYITAFGSIERPQ